MLWLCCPCMSALDGWKLHVQVTNAAFAVEGNPELYNLTDTYRTAQYRHVTDIKPTFPWQSGDCPPTHLAELSGHSSVGGIIKFGITFAVYHLDGKQLDKFRLLFPLFLLKLKLDICTNHLGVDFAFFVCVFFYFLHVSEVRLWLLHFLLPKS